MELIQKSTFRSYLGKITKKIPIVHRLFVSIYHLAILEVWPRLMRISGLSKRSKALSRDLNEFLSLQSVQVLSLNISPPKSDKELVKLLAAADIPFCEGGWTIYLPPSDELSKVLPDILSYPANAGVKILRDIKPPQEASYTPNSLRPTPGAAHVRARTPDPKTLLRIAGYLSNEDIGPVVYDMVELEIGGVSCTAYICEHIESSGPITSDEYDAFIERLGTVLALGVIGIAHGDYRVSTDFAAPDCNGNLLKSNDGRMSYVDFQSFTFVDEKKAFQEWTKQSGSNILFGPRRLGKASNYLYQMIPGIGEAKRETITRWKFIDELLSDAHLELDGRITFDIGCNSGLMSYYALSKGAKWAYGWDQSNIANASQELLRQLGASRWTTFGGAITEETNFLDSLPKEQLQENSGDGVLLYLAISGHIGFPGAVADLPWEYCIYEGHSNQDIELSIDKIKSSWSENELKIHAKGKIKDDDSPARPFVIFSRH